MRPVDEILAWARETGVGDGIRVLLTFGDPEGNAVGDTAIATDHYRFLKTLWPELSLTVWTRDWEIWNALCGGEIRWVTQLSVEALKTAYDVVVLDWATPETANLILGTEFDAVLINLGSCRNHCEVRIGDGPWRNVLLPPHVNQTRRLTQVYEALGIQAESNGFVAHPGCIASASGPVYINPYGSRGDKCLSATLLDHLLSRLPHLFPEIQFVCPSFPGCRSEVNGPIIDALHEVISKHRNKGNLAILPQLTSAEYVYAVSRCRMVIGPDTSSQHIATVFGIPSVSCFPCYSNYSFYFWGPNGNRRLYFHMPPESELPQIRSLGRLLEALTRNMICENLNCNRTTSPAAPRIDPQSLGRFLETCRAIAVRSIDWYGGFVELQNLIELFKTAIPVEWHLFLVPELEQVATELCRRARSNPGLEDDVAIARLMEINALKTMYLLCKTHGDYGLPR